MSQQQQENKKLKQVLAVIEECNAKVFMKQTLGERIRGKKKEVYCIDSYALLQKPSSIDIVADFMSEEITALRLPFDALIAMDGVIDYSPLPIATQVARKLGKPLYVWRGHENMLTGCSTIHPKNQPIIGKILLPIGINYNRSESDAYELAIDAMSRKGIISNEVFLFEGHDPTYWRPRDFSGTIHIHPLIQSSDFNRE